MNLVIDQGNTICKLAFFEKGDEPFELLTCECLTVAFLEKALEHHHPQAGILSSVKELKPEIIEFIGANLLHFLLLDSNTPLPIKNAYQTPETLGLDRLAAAVGAWGLQPGKPLLVVDMGTAITYDFVREDGTYMGGNIAPGLQMRLKTLHENTDKLPLVKAEHDFVFMGTDTQSAIRSGAMQGIVYEIEGYFQNLQQKHSDLFAFLTGGDLIYFDGKLKNGIFVSKKLVLIGLNRILQYNVNS